MKKISKLLSILLAAALGMSLAACGGESTSTPAAASQSLGEVTSPQSTAPEHSEAPEGSEAPGMSANPTIHGNLVIHTFVCPQIKRYQRF